MKALILIFLFILAACDASPKDKVNPAQHEQVTTDASVLKQLKFPPRIAAGSQGILRLPPSDTLYNAEAVIPPQCYTMHEGQYNPCMTCHQSYPYRSRPNTMNDSNLQSVYAFSDLGLSNHWQNLFEDRQQKIADISDQQVIDYLYTDNYSPLIEQLKSTPDWQGPIPEIKNLHLGAAAFDQHGIAKDGSHWVAFNYKPLPSTFWPTNGSTDDVMIRLPAKFRQSSCQNSPESRDAYLANLSILEMAIKDLDQISLPDIDENAVCQDLNADGKLGIIQTLRRPSHYIGGAADEVLSPMLYPLGTEFLHSVRYVGIDKSGAIGLPPRMKELRYMRKYDYYNPNHLVSKYGNEFQEKVEGLLPQFIHRDDQGTDNSFGWMLLGFIENQQGQLRKQSDEEQLFCMGCHTTIGSTIDQTFAFARKVTGAEGWSYIDLVGMPDAPNVDTQNANEGEIAHYLRTVGGGNEFRENDEIRQRFFNADGSLNTTAVQGLDVYQLITPSLRRALDLNKAYMTIVADQDFIHGRDANLKPVTNVHKEIDPETTPVLPGDKAVQWDIRLQWTNEEKIKNTALPLSTK
ncbi:hypothetical protein HNQ57_003408 [Zhongshania antarctica]|uniref:Lipoprotein n=1 Tax=Zhongshania antarctica TaxID=641702 RepID=A0A840R9B4_9GAMM|nr:hypothetical protein [Zhongshania antarctica]MBB5189108.1 hypothetical protein [Zhongshania antarctica]